MRDSISTSKGLIIRDVTVLTMDDDASVISPGTIVIRGPRIAAVLETGSEAEQETVSRSHEDGLRVVSGHNRVALPGLINVHTHVSEILLRGGISCDRDLYDWQWNVTYPAIRNYVEGDVAIAATLFCVDALKSGTTSFVDNANTGLSVSMIEAAVTAYQSCGVRAIIAPTFAVGPVPDARLLRLASAAQGQGATIVPADTLRDLSEVRSLIEPLMAKYNHTGRSVRIWPAPHKPNRTSVESIQMSYELAEKHGAMVSQPCSEVQSEETVEGIGAVEFLKRRGLLSEKTLLGHCVYASDRELRFVAESRTPVAHLATANLYLGSGVARVPLMKALGIQVALGTDNANCNDTVNMISEMRIAALVHKGVSRDAGALTAHDVLFMATRNGAMALGMADSLGSITVGKLADIVLIDMDYTHLTPLHDPEATLVFQGNGAERKTVIVGGRVLVEDGILTFMDEKEERELRIEAQRRSKELVCRTGLSVGKGSRPAVRVRER